MKLLVVSALLCTMMVLTAGAFLPYEDVGSGAGGFIRTAKSDRVSMSSCCPHGWTRFNHRCFLYVPRSMSWAHAEENCLSMGAHLASVHSSWEYHLIQELTAPHGYKETWIGGTDVSWENVWLWSDGSSFHYTYWCPGEPNNGCGKQHCLQINYTGSKCWDDRECDYHLPSICATKTSRHLD